MTDDDDVARLSVALVRIEAKLDTIAERVDERFERFAERLHHVEALSGRDIDATAKDAAQADELLKGLMMENRKAVSRLDEGQRDQGRRVRMLEDWRLKVTVTASAVGALVGGAAGSVARLVSGS